MIQFEEGSCFRDIFFVWVTVGRLLLFNQGHRVWILELLLVLEKFFGPDESPWILCRIIMWSCGHGGAGIHGPACSFRDTLESTLRRSRILGIFVCASSDVVL